jgi:hypothetical protein
MDLAACDGIGQSQDGLITRRQALRVLTTSQLERLVARGAWKPLYPSSYRMTGVRETWRRRVQAATMARENTVASHRTAAYLWGIIERQPTNVEVLTPFKKSARLPDARVHRTRKWHELMLVEIDGIAITTPARTIIDLSSCSTFNELRSAIDAAITKRLLRLSDISDELERIGTRGRRYCRILMAVLSKMDKRFEKAGSGGEIIVGRWIKNGDFPPPVPQLRIDVSPTQTFYPDFAYPEKKIAIEVQSWRWHGGPAQYERDAEKAIALNAMGWIVLPVLPRKPNKANFLQALRRLLAERGP